MADAQTMTAEQAAALRAPFPPEAIGQLPKPYKADSPKGECSDCGQRHGLPAMHLDYVGHAAVTDRLLQVDPGWTWEPMATDPNTGAPLMVGDGLWIRLTVCGVTRVGFGDGKSTKERIGDAIRNAAMRFGVALDLWSKESLIEGQHDEPGTARPDPDAAARHGLRTQIADLAREHEWDTAVLGQEFTATYGVSTMTASPADLAAYLRDLQQRATLARLDAEPADPPSPDVPPAGEGARKTADDYLALLRDASTKKEVIALIQQSSMDGLADAEVEPEGEAATTLSAFATARLRAVSA